MRSRQQRRAFTAIELLIVLVLMAMMLTLLAPAVLSERDAAQYQLSRRKMKVTALALHNYNDTHRTFPPLYFVSTKGVLKNNQSPVNAAGMYTWLFRLTAFIEEDLLYKSINVASNKFTLPSDSIKVRYDGAEVAPSEISIAFWQAPQLGKDHKPGTCNYIALPSTRLPRLTNVENRGDGQQIFKVPGPDGMIIPDTQGRGQSLQRMEDGLSKTAVVCESREVLNSNWYRPQESFVCGFLPADTVAATKPLGEYYPYYLKGELFPNPAINRTALNFGPTETELKRMYHDDPEGRLTRTWGPAGGHANGVTIHGMGDASTITLAADIDPKIYFAMITVSGGEEVELPLNDHKIFNDAPKSPSLQPPPPAPRVNPFQEVK
jgi:type II secretory pathway pseudopilin PulG